MANPKPRSWPKGVRTVELCGKRDEEPLAAYCDMAQEEEREAEAHAWAEATVEDVADEASGNEGGTRGPLGSRIASRFTGLGLTSKALEDNDLEAEYDFSGAVRGKYYQSYQQDRNVVLPAVTIQLTEEQQQAIVSAEDTPPKVVAPRTGAAYVLIPLADYEVVREIIEEERRQEVIGKLALKNAAGRTQKKT